MLAKIKVPFLTTHGDNDETNPLSGSKLLYAMASTCESQKTLLICKGAKHNLLAGTTIRDADITANDCLRLRMRACMCKPL